MSSALFLTGGPAATLVLLLAAVAGAVLAAAEWRRPDRGQRGARVGASLAAVGALALLALRPAARPGGPSGETTTSGPEVALWTGGPRPPDEHEILKSVPANFRFRLPGADAPGETPTVPDAATLRRHVPHGGTLHLLGDGLDADVLAVLTPGGPVAFHPGPETASGAGEPQIVDLRAPRVLAPGTPFRVTGRVRGGTPGEVLGVRLEGPGSMPTTGPVGTEDGTFQIQVPGWPAPGRYGWKLRLVGGPRERVVEEESGGVSVVGPELPRVLILEGSPHGDSAVLRHWLGAAGGGVASRTEVGRGRYRFATTNGEHAPGEFATVDAALFARFDLVLIDVPALVGLPVPERETLRRTVEEGSVGVLVWGRSPVAGKPEDLPPGDRAFFLPWPLVPTGDETSPEAGSDRPARLRWTDRGGGEAAPDAPVPMLPFRLTTGGVEETVVLARDGQGRTVAARVGRGRGRLALTVTTDTGQWRRAGQPEAFAGFWSTILGDLAPPSREGRWTLAGEAANSPAAWVDGPVGLRWQAGTGRHHPEKQAASQVTAEEAPEGDLPTPLPLAMDATEPTRGTARFWPRHPGWHRVETPLEPGVAGLDFYVAPAGAWPGVRAAGRRRATARFVNLANDDRPGVTPAAVLPSRSDSGAAAGGLFLVFITAVGFLWAEGRRKDQQSLRERPSPRD